MDQNSSWLEDIVFIDKSAGWLTHSDGVSPGIVEKFEKDLGQPLKVVHRLDRDTTGALLTAKGSEAAAQLTELFTQRKVKKKYLFVSKAQPTFQARDVENFIRKEKGTLSCSSQGKPSEKAATRLKMINQLGEYSLWQAEPETGRTHQVRLHAAHSGIPIYGDSLYGGARAQQILLHCQSLSFAQNSFESPLPLLMQDLSLLSRPRLVSWLCQVDRRQRLLSLLFADARQTLRLVHDKDGTGYNCDRLGESLWFYRFLSEAMSEDEIQDIEWLTQHFGLQQSIVRRMSNRGRNPQNLSSDKEALNERMEGKSSPRRWVAEEDSSRFVFYDDRGWSPGLFLDQRENRRWVGKNSSHRSVLNLFCYTGGFSVVAALGGASQVTSVDTSRHTLDWAKENFLENGIDQEQHQFWAMDAREFLKMAVRQKRSYDLVICDPPSFARSKKSLFRIADEFSGLLSMIQNLLNPDGQILFCTNYEKWDFDEMIHQVPQGWSSTPLRTTTGDHELPSESPIMKSLLITPSNDRPSRPS